MVTTKDIERSISFNDLYQLYEKLVKEKDTTGENKSDAYVNYTKLSFARKKCILSTTVLSEGVMEAISQINNPITLKVLNQSWCGDAVQSVNVFEKMIALNPNNNIYILIRDENLEVKDNYHYARQQIYP